jgi:outer membrane protein OmpA-like peptidoglycan-associated protein
MDKTFCYTALMSAILLAGCSSSQLNQMQNTVNDLGKNYGTAILCGAGMVVGGGLGYAANGKNGALAGAAVGTALGCYAGSVWQGRMQELERIAKEQNLNISVQPLQLQAAVASAAPIDAGLVVQVDDTSMFASGSDQLTVSGQQTAAKLAQAFAKTEQKDAQNRRLLVVGHTDATGSSELNQQLSERRARTVGKALLAAGIPATAIYYQGAGASRPIAANSDPLTRGKNRRVEIVEMTSEQVLVQRARAEEANTKYLAYGTSTEKPRSKAAVISKSATPAVTAAGKQTPPVASIPKASSKPAGKSTALVDFGGVAAADKQWNLAQNIQPKSDGFSLISSAHANDMPVGSCAGDRPRESGQVLSLATDKPLEGVKTRDYLPGYNNRVWANTVNGHLVTISPVSILRESVEVAKQPFIQVVKNYDQGNRKALPSLKAVANTYEGEREVLYRVFINEPTAAVSCIDVVFSKGNAKAERGALFYPAGNDSLTVAYVPVRN